MKVIISVAVVLTLSLAINWIYQVIRKPSELFFPVSGTLYKTPSETWQQYAPIFRKYATNVITPTFSRRLRKWRALEIRWSARTGVGHGHHSPSRCTGRLRAPSGYTRLPRERLQRLRRVDFRRWGVTQLSTRFTLLWRVVSIPKSGLDTDAHAWAISGA
jgi:hypothetical protein